MHILMLCKYLVYARTYMCMHVYMCDCYSGACIVCIHTDTYMRRYVNVYEYNVYAYIHAYMQTFIHTCIHSHTHKRTRTRTHAHT